MKGRNDTTPAKADTGHFENPADAEAAKQVAAGLAAGEDVFGDHDNDAGTPMTTAAAPAPAPAPATDDTTTVTGADDQARELIGKIAPDYKPWFAPLIAPASGEIASLIGDQL